MFEVCHGGKIKLKNVPLESSDEGEDEQNEEGDEEDEEDEEGAKSECTDGQITDEQHAILINAFKEYGDVLTKSEPLSAERSKRIVPKNFDKAEWDGFLELSKI